MDGRPPIQGDPLTTTEPTDMDARTFGRDIAHIDLTNRTFTKKPAPQEWVDKYIGGRGLGVRYVLENGVDVDPLARQHPLLHERALSGSETSMSGRWAAVTKSPLTHTVTDSHQGGWSAARVRWAGFDGLVFEGKADRPVYVFIENGEIDIRDASDTWGLGIHETVAFYQERYGEKNLSVNAIGQAGENLSRFAVWVNEDDRAFGRGGTGAVGGSKNLKAIVVRAGNEKSDVPDNVAWQGARKAALDTIRDEKNITSPKKGGSRSTARTC